MQSAYTTPGALRKAATGSAPDFVQQQRAERARWLEEVANFELFLGHTATAERLAHKAFALRQARS